MFIYLFIDIWRWHSDGGVLRNCLTATVEVKGMQGDKSRPIAAPWRSKEPRKAHKKTRPTGHHSVTEGLDI